MELFLHHLYMPSWPTLLLFPYLFIYYLSTYLFSVYFSEILFIYLIRLGLCLYFCLFSVLSLYLTLSVSFLVVSARLIS
jgi:hypothetical protein